MPRPRFEKLPPAKRDRILEVAAVEFASRGFEPASLNRIIEAAGISKGAAYYYFDDKADLFAAVVRHGFDAMLPATGFDPALVSRETFWPTLGRLYEELIAQTQARPWLVAVGKLVYGPPPSPQVSSLVADMFLRARRWLASLVERGQQVGTIRADVPADFLLAVLAAALEAADRWIVEQLSVDAAPATETLPFTLFEMLRRMIEPPAPGSPS
jgi:AcrR family transcriptional regulator